MTADSDSKIVQAMRAAAHNAEATASCQSHVMSSDEVVAAVKGELFRRLDSAPWGTRSRLQRKMKVGKNFVAGLRKASRICLHPLAQILELLQVNPAEFFVSALTPKRMQSLLSSVLPPPGEPPASVAYARRRLERLQQPRNAAANQAEVFKLEALRWDNPLAAKEELERAILEWPIAGLPEVLLVYGSTLRQLERLGEARWAYFAVETWARNMKDRRVLASALQRRSWVEFAEGNASGSLELLRTAAGIFEELGDSKRSARVLVSIATQYVESGELREGMTCAEAALEKLPECEVQYRFSAHQVLAYSSKELGDTPAALRHLNAASGLLEHCPKAARIRFVWLESKLKRELYPLEKAADFLKNAATYFDEIGEVEASTLALLEFTRCLVDLKRMSGLQQVAESLRSAAFRVDDGSAAGSISATALMEVYRIISIAAASAKFNEAEILLAVQEAAGALAAPAAIEV